MQLSDQEIVRRENLEKIKALGFDPFPADQVPVNFQSTAFTTAMFQKQLIHILTTLEGVNVEGSSGFDGSYF